MSTLKILIVGAGIAGLAAAKAFELRGYRPEIVERCQECPTSGQSIFLLGNAMRALRDLGLRWQVQASAFPIRAQTILSSRGDILNHVVTDAVWDGCGPCVAILRRALIDLMVASLSSTRIKFATTVMHSTVRSKGREVHFSNGRSGNYDLVIGADGIRSSMRACAFARTAPHAIGLSAWRLLLENRYGIDHWTAMLGSGRSLLAIPLNNSKLYLYADCRSEEYGDGALETMKLLFRDFSAPLGPIVADLNDDAVRHCATLEEVPEGNYVADRIVLIGDAAHASSPSMAQGAGMAIEDALVLAECVSRAPDVNKALSQFSEQRRHRVAWVRKQARARDKLRGSPDFVRNLVLRTLGTTLYRRSYDVLTEPLWP